MAVIFNAKGTTSPYFLLGKGGTTLFQGSSDPTGSYSASAGDVWFDTNANTLKFRNSGNNGWEQGSILDGEVQLLAGGHIVLNLASGRGIDYVAGSSRNRLQCVHQWHTCREGGGQGAGKAGIARAIQYGSYNR